MNISDLEQYKQYGRAPAAVKAAGGNTWCAAASSNRWKATGGKPACRPALPQSFDAAKRFYDGEMYRQASTKRAELSYFNMVLVEGVETPLSPHRHFDHLVLFDKGRETHGAIVDIVGRECWTAVATHGGNVMCCWKAA